MKFPRDSVRRALRGLTLGALCALAGCEIAPPRPPGAPHATYTATTFAALPGWNDDRVDASWPAFRVGCKTLVARARAKATWQAPCAASESVDENDAVAVRTFF